ncbi:hypothetical protein A3D00_05230 [Candidatus Woesebacteria bacterium RIFCSPHIGHO2_02_FULL_38_9]|uniref:PIN domain-containing protein n=1 Tax=Candidatus Woesebacteria bacterium RIFCSPHIGHO2_01_FULL_39_28 TaxID=1802496 RepID=A0A1F7YI73_9BACT|nr:MAG: hypothetical protein A2627_01835 [Candidatus Woesebacteria bacterium RIFCSPHIGHO2_01_FULL_39_28]OGM32722.1 MAG: hypothetical protein A3D00_05230 [Candidatus Woesebacteria bacterium RIFCSPHIGHO2_02_FULL_38_9]OGM57014.1 MAG: hypothetical protein A3A50_03450 [Candidatus Woesebacteria bacterium RIFCSPLOWO2_01_FULL_38_20]
MDKIFVDTNILIDFSKGKSDLLKLLFREQKSGGVALYINPVVIAEYFTDERLASKEELEKAKNFINFFSLVYLSKKEGILTGELMRKKEVEFIGDALIASTCLINDFKLVTRNKKHFSKVPGLKFN